MNKRIFFCLILVFILSVFLLTGCGEPSGTEMTLQLSFGERTGIYDGEVDENGIPNGMGTFTTTNSEGVKWTYRGQFVDGHFEGEGTTTWEDGSREVGTYHNDDIQPEPKENIPKMYKNPEEYRDHYFEITGAVVNVNEFKDGTTQIQMFESLEHLDRFSTISVDGEVDLSVGEYIKVGGVVNGIVEYDTKFDTTIRAVNIRAYYVDEIDYIEAMAPTLKKVKVNKSTTLYGYKVTVKKVEFSEKETRVYVRVDNGGGSNVHFFSHNALVVQDGVQFDIEYNYEANYPDLESDLRPGNHTEAILVFHGLEQKDFKFIITGYSDNVWESSHDYEIEVDVD